MEGLLTGRQRLEQQCCCYAAARRQHFPPAAAGAGAAWQHHAAMVMQGAACQRPLLLHACLLHGIHACCMSAWYRRRGAAVRVAYPLL